MTDSELIPRAGRGDVTAFELLYERHRMAVYRYCWLLSGSVADAEDVTQECFLALVRKPSAFDGERAQLRTWLIAVARRQWLNRRRGLARESEELSDVAVPAGFEDELLRVERAEAVRRAMNALPPQQREALYLFEFEGLSMSEIGAILEIEVNAVKARLFRGRENLKRLLKVHSL
jgi:RNA polymerase sigma-70 factor (ECF subfamily)